MAQNGHRITTLALSSNERDEADAKALRSYCERVETVHISRARSVWSCIRGTGTSVPFQAWFCHAPEMRRRVEQELSVLEGSSRRYDLVHVEHLRAALYGMELTQLPRVYDSVDCISHLLQQARRLGRTFLSRLVATLDLARTRQFERILLWEFERTLVSSEQERAALADVAGAGRGLEGEKAALTRILVLPNGVDLEYFKTPEGPREEAMLVYVGRMGYHANITAVRRLIREIMPGIWRRRPDAKLVIVGSDPPRSIRTLATRFPGRVEVTGYVADTRPYLARATISVSPLVYAVGIQNKILEAMAMQVPVVATPPACTGIGAVPGEDLFVEADSERFSDRVVALLGDGEMRARLARNGRRYVAANHDWGVVARKLEEIYRETIGAFAAGRMSHAPAAGGGMG